MSHIAAALAKSKGKAVTPPPETSVPTTTPGLGVSAPPIEVAVAAATPRSSRALVVAAALLLVGGGGGAWWYFSRPSETVAVKAAAPAAAVPKPELSANVAANQRTEQAVMKALNNQPAAPSPEPVATAPAPAEDFFELVRKMSVSAVVEGPKGRAMINGKMTQLGQEVAPGLTLHEIRGGRLIFRDAAGSDYPRRF